MMSPPECPPDQMGNSSWPAHVKRSVGICGIYADHAVIRDDAQRGIALRHGRLAGKFRGMKLRFRGFQVGTVLRGQCERLLQRNIFKRGIREPVG